MMDSASNAGQPNERPPAVIRLDDFLKRRGLVGTGGEAKLRIQAGEVRVNGEIELRRRKQLALGDRVQWLDHDLTVTSDL